MNRTSPSFLRLLSAALLFGAASLPAQVKVTLVNADPSGHPFTRFDVDGNALDAHDGSLRLFDGTYYLYGTSYACGYEYQVNSTFCGFKVYSSPDLIHWTDRGHVVPPGDCRYCFRPHVIHNAATRSYVLWSDGGGGYHVYSSPTPVGPFTRKPTPSLAVGGAVDLALFADESDGSAYVIHNTTMVDPGLTADMVVEPLAADGLGTTGKSVRLGLGDVEAFAVFRRRGRYHALMSDPSCAYCSGGSGEMTSSAMLGPWAGSWYDPDGVHQGGRKEPRQRARLVNADNCGGQPHSVLPVVSSAGDTAYLFVSDRWNTKAPNQGLANLFFGPLSFSPDGTMLPFTCVDRFELDLKTGSPGAYNVPRDLDASSGFEGFRYHCDISGATQRRQTFTPTRDGTLTRLTATVYQSGRPDKGLLLELLDDAGAVLHSRAFAPASVAWSPEVVESEPVLPVKAGRTYALRLRSETSQGCYGWHYNDADPYAGGAEGYSVDGGASFTDEPMRDLKFTVEVKASTGIGKPSRSAKAMAGADLRSGMRFRDGRDARGRWAGGPGNGNGFGAWAGRGPVRGPDGRDSGRK